MVQLHSMTASQSLAAGVGQPFDELLLGEDEDGEHRNRGQRGRGQLHVPLRTTIGVSELPQALTQFTDAYGGPKWNVQLAASTLATVPVLAVFVFAQKQFIEGLAHTGSK